MPLSVRWKGRWGRTDITMDSTPVISHHMYHLALGKGNFIQHPFDQSLAVPFSLPPSDVKVHFIATSLFFVNIVT
jgi:hypothetical protein